MLSYDRQLKIKEAVISLGYTKEMIRDDFSFLGCKGITIANSIAFGSMRHFDLETACLGIHFSQNGYSKILEDFKMLAIPYGILACSDKVQIYPLNKSGIGDKHEMSYDSIGDFFMEHRSAFSPTAILKAKEQGSQLSFADIDMGSLYDWGFNANKDKLKSNLETAIANAKSKLQKKQLLDLSKISIRLLAASILQDKGYLGISQNAIELLKSAQTSYPDFFSADYTQILKEEVLEGLLKDIRAEGCIFTNLTTEMLDHLYQYAFVSDELRRKLGIYPTPPKLARMIVNNLPFEDIRPEKLLLLDGSCGSGSLLVAGHKRLYQLLPVSETEDAKYQYLSEHILGIDKDTFAADITQLSMLHESLPFGNRWKIMNKDFKKTGLDDLPASPAIILANPPYGEVHKKEKAIPFVEKNLDLLCDGGLMAIILPETFLQKSSCKDVRKRILQECEILETWQLPEGIFEESSSATTVLFLRKNMKKPLNFPVRVKRILNKDKTEFLSRGITSFSYIFPEQGRWESEKTNFQIVPNVFNELWEKLSKIRKLGDIAAIKNGIKPGRNREDHFCHDNSPEGWRKWLNGPSALHPFFIDWENQSRKKRNGNLYVNWPGILEAPRKALKEIFEAKDRKIIINALRNPDTRWRIMAAIDGVGYFPSNDLFVIFDLQNDLAIEELTGVLNHAVISAWIDDHIRSRYFHKDQLKQIPIPVFSETQKKTIKHLVRKLMNKPADSEYQRIIRQIDDIVDTAFGLSGEEKFRLKAAGFVREGVEEEEHKKFPDKTWIVTGIVEDVYAHNNKVKVWFRGFDEDAKEILIPPEMPGWAIRKDVAFEAEIPFDKVDNPDWNELHNFRPIRYSYMSEEELLENLKARGCSK